MKESPNKRGRKNSLLPWLLLGILAVCLAIFLYFYGQENNYTLLSDDYSQTESGIASPEENSTSSQMSGRESSPASSRTGSSPTSGHEQEESRPAQSLPESFGETPSATISAPETGATSSSSVPSGEEETFSASQQIAGLTVYCETEEQQGIARLWLRYAQQESLFQRMESRGTPVTVYLHAGEGEDTAGWEDGYTLHCYVETEDRDQMYRDMALLLEEMLRQNGRWEQSAAEYRQYNPNGFVYGNIQEEYVELYFISAQGQQSLEADRLEVWVLVLQNLRSELYGGVAEKFDCLMAEYQRLVM